MPHALLLLGQRGAGRRGFADRLARALLCGQAGDQGQSCGQCRGCLLFLAGTHPDFLSVFPEKPGQAIKAEAVRSLTGFVTASALAGRWRIVLMDPASAMNLHAANALLKILEEPPAFTLFLLVSGEPLPLTVMSRCQKLLFPAPEKAEKRVCGDPALAVLQEAFYLDWVQVGKGELSFLAFGEKWAAKTLPAEITSKILLDWLYHCTLGCFRQQYDAGKGTALPVKKIAVLAFSTVLQQACRALTAVPGLNRQLLLETLAIEWTTTCS